MANDPSGKTDSPDSIIPSEVMTSVQVMAYLRVSRTKLWKLVKDDGLPAFKLGDKGDYRYLKSEIDQWIRQQSINTSKPDTTTP